MSSQKTTQGLETKNKVDSTALRMGYDANNNLNMGNLVQREHKIGWNKGGVRRTQKPAISTKRYKTGPSLMRLRYYEGLIGSRICDIKNQ